METIRELRRICQIQISEKSKLRKKGMGLWGYEKHRIFSIYITKAILKLTKKRIRANFISFFNILFGIIILSLIVFTGNKVFSILLLILFYFSFLLDKVDGEIARYQKRITLKGMYLDEIYHLFVQSGLILAVGTNRFLFGGGGIFLFFGVVGYILFFLIRYIRKVRYIIYAHKYRYYESRKTKLLTRKDVGVGEKFISAFLNNWFFKLSAIISRHDVFLFLVIVFSVFFFNLVWFWFWLLFILHFY